MSAKRIVPEHAYVWTCPTCGEDNFNRLVQKRMSAAESQEAFEEFTKGTPMEGMDLPEFSEEDVLVFHIIPDAERCSSCSSLYLLTPEEDF